jgi:hypothetical protein
LRDPHRDLGNFRIRQNEKGNQMAKKNYKNKPDIFTATARHADPVADAIYHSLLPLDRIATEMELKWGCERLASLVSPNTASRFGSAKAKLDAAIMANDPTLSARRASVLAKGWRAMDVEATQSGHRALSPDIWSHTTQEGFKMAVARSTGDAIKAIKVDDRLQGVRVYSIEEIGRILQIDSNALVNAAKEHFPDAVVTKVARKGSLTDEIPF